MRTITFYLATMLCLLASKVCAQETFEEKAKAIAVKIETVTKEEKAKLKTQIEDVNKQLENGTITAEQANEQKAKLAQASAAVIESKVNSYNDELRALVQQKVDGKIKKSAKTYDFTFKTKNDSLKEVSHSRTTSQGLFAIGFNNVITNGSVENSDFKYLTSRFYEWGFTYNTRISKNDNLLHFLYGASLMYNDLRPTDNRVFVTNGNQTQLQTSAINLKDARFRNVYLVVPMHLEFDFTKKKEKDGKTIFRNHDSFRLGFGGYAGARIKSKQKTEYAINDLKYQEKVKGDFNASDFIYGVSAFIGHKSSVLYVKYDLNPMFTNNAIEQNNVSLGIRWDFD
jgi:hypothetical protein